MINYKIKYNKHNNNNKKMTNIFCLYYICQIIMLHYLCMCLKLECFIYILLYTNILFWSWHQILQLCFARMVIA